MRVNHGDCAVFASHRNCKSQSHDGALGTAPHTPFMSRRGTRRTTWLAQCTEPYMEVMLEKSITRTSPCGQQARAHVASDH
jgi:hypothetical protein